MTLYNRRVSLIRPVAGAQSVSDHCMICGGEPEATFAIQDLSAIVVTCGKCGLGWLSPQPSANEIASFYPDDYYGAVGRKFIPLIELFIKFITARHTRFLVRHVAPGGRILDIGCGRGVLLKAISQQGFEAHGVEISAAAALGIDPSVHLCVCDSLAEARYEAEFFDAVVLWHVLEHLPNPKATLEEIKRILKPGGILLVAVPNYSSLQAKCFGAAWFHLDLPRHLFHFPVNALRQLLIQLQFDLRSEHHFSLRQNPFGWVQSAWNMFPSLPRNGIYELLYRRSAGGQIQFATRTQWLMWAAFLIGMPIGLLISVFAALLSRGATIHLVASAPLVTHEEKLPLVSPTAANSFSVPIQSTD